MSQCSDCVYGRTSLDGQGFLECRRRPPVVMDDPYRSPRHASAFWPAVNPEDWCGEYAEPVTAVAHTAHVRVRTVSTTLNNAVPNGGLLRFDTVEADTDGFSPATSPFDTITIPYGFAGVYLLIGTSSSTANQSTTLGMGILINGATLFSETNQSISGPSSVNYTLDNNALDIGQLNDGDTIQLVNNSVSSGTNVFTSVLLDLARLGA